VSNHWVVLDVGPPSHPDTAWPPDFVVAVQSTKIAIKVIPKDGLCQRAMAYSHCAWHQHQHHQHQQQQQQQQQQQSSQSCYTLTLTCVMCQEKFGAASALCGRMTSSLVVGKNAKLQSSLPESPPACPWCITSRSHQFSRAAAAGAAALGEAYLPHSGVLPPPHCTHFRPHGNR